MAANEDRMTTLSEGQRWLTWFRQAVYSIKSWTAYRGPLIFFGTSVCGPSYRVPKAPANDY